MVSRKDRRRTIEARKGLQVVRTLGHLFWEELCNKVDYKLVTEQEEEQEEK